jgi:hypothetical protein
MLEILREKRHARHVRDTHPNSSTHTLSKKNLSEGSAEVSNSLWDQGRGTYLIILLGMR